MDPFRNFNRAGVLRVVGVRAISFRDLSHFLYIARGDGFLMAHDGGAYIYNNGAFTIFTSIFPESLLSTRPSYAQCFGRAVWGISKRGGPHGRIVLESMKALAGSCAAISGNDVSEIDGVGGRIGKGTSLRNARVGS